MLNGYGLKCSKCFKEYDVMWDSRFLYPNYYKKALRAVKDGEYGKELKEIALSEKYMAIDAVPWIYSCRKCNHWEESSALSLYAPNSSERAKEILANDRSDEYYCDGGFVDINQLHKEYHLIKRVYHRCPRCNTIMHRVKEMDMLSLPCPDCGGDPDWDYISGPYMME